MPRSEARIKVSIWDDHDFTALTIDAQWMYTMLCSQPNVSHAGVLTIPRREWANLAGDDDAASRIASARTLLVERRFILVDDETDELLIRSMIRTDIVDGPPGPFRAAMDAAVATRSPVLRAALYAELLRLDEGVIAEKKAAHRQELPVAAYRRALAALGPDGPRGTPAPGDQMMLGGLVRERDANPRDAMPHSSAHAMSNGVSPHAMSHAMAHGPGDGDGEVLRLTSSSTQDPSSAVELALVRADTPTSTAGATTSQRVQALTATYVERVPLTKFVAARGVINKAVRCGRYTDPAIETALHRLADDNRGLTSETLRYELDGPPKRRSRKTTTDDRVAATLAHLRPEPEQGTA